MIDCVVCLFPSSHYMFLIFIILQANKETIVEIEESVRGKDVFIIQVHMGKCV